MNTSYSLEPELMAALPRKVVTNSRAASVGLGCLRLFILPFILVGVGLVFAILAPLALSLVHAETGGIVIHKEMDTSEDSTNYRIHYRYRAGGHEYHARDTVGFKSYGMVSEGAGVRVWYFPGLAGLYSFMMLPGRSGFEAMPFFLLFCVIWNGLLSIFVWVFYVAPVQRKWLYRWGAVTQGTVVGKRSITSEDSTSWTLSYEYHAEESPGEILKGNANITEEQYEQVQEGDRLTVLYDPRRPKRNAAYAHGGYRVVSDALL